MARSEPSVVQSVHLKVICMELTRIVSCRAGGISSLQRLWPNGRVGTQWADPKNPLGRFVYSSYTQMDYAELFATYMYIDPTEWWVSRDYGKYNVSEANPQRKDAFPDAKQFWFRKVGVHSSLHTQTILWPLAAWSCHEFQHVVAW